MLLNPPKELDQLPDQVAVQQAHFVQFQHQAIGEVLLEQRPKLFCQRQRLGFRQIEVPYPHQEPIGTAFNVQMYSRERPSA